VTSYDDDHDGLVAAALRERSRHGEPPMALTADAVLAGARRRTRYRRVLGAAAAATVLAAGGGLATQLAHHGGGNDQLVAGGTPTSPAPTSSAASPGADGWQTIHRGGAFDPKRKPTPSEQQAIERYQAAFAAALPGLVHGLTPVPGDYFKTGTVAPYSFALVGNNIEQGEVWLRSGAGTGAVSIVIASDDFGVPTHCAGAMDGTNTCAASTTASGDQVVTMTGTGAGPRYVLVYLTKRDGTRMVLVSSADTEGGKHRDHTAAALSHLPVTAEDLVTLADDPAFTAHP
jgi:hypothetical protein